MNISLVRSSESCCHRRAPDGILLFAPFFGSMVIPARVKVVLVVALTAMLYPMTASKIRR